MLITSVLFAILLVTGPALAADKDLWIESRGIQVPVTLTTPGAETEVAAPLVVLVHGHGGTRQENGAFVELASMLAEIGIASIRMDFPGCGDSTEAFTHNNITNMLHDLESATRFALQQPGIDGQRVGMLGYSMGGRIVMLSDLDQVSAMVLWAPVAADGPQPMFDFFGGRASYFRLKEQAETDGSASFTTAWGQQQQIGRQWFVDMHRTAPLEQIRAYAGQMLVIHGTADEAVDVANAFEIEDVAPGASINIIDGAGHGFGFFGGEPDVRAEVLGATVDFFTAQLLPD